MGASTEAYRNMDLTTASQRRIVLRLYETGVQAIEAAEAAFRSSGEEAARQAEEPLRRALVIVGGLLSSLNFEAGELARNLLRLYLFALERIRASRAEARDAGLAQARRVLEILRSGWAEMPPASPAQTAGPLRAPVVDVRG